MKGARLLLAIAALGFAGFGLAYAFFPRQLAGSVGIALQNESGRTDFVATYGGLQLGLAAFLWYCTRRDERVAPGLLASGFALAGFGIARLAGILVSGETMAVLKVVAALEIGGALLCFWAARSAQGARRTHAPSPPTLGI